MVGYTLLRCVQVERRVRPRHVMVSLAPTFFSCDGANSEVGNDYAERTKQKSSTRP